MAFISKEQVQEKNKKLKELNKKYGVKGILSGSNSSTLNLTVHEGSLDFVSLYIENINSLSVHAAPYYGSEENRKNTINQIKSHANISINHYYLTDLLDSKCLDYLQDSYEIMLEGHYDNSDPMTDYFNCAWYMNIRIGKWDKPYMNIRIGKWDKPYKFKK